MTEIPLSRQSDIVVQETANELLIYDLRINKAFCLNETSALVHQFCDGSRTVSKISDLMSKKLKTKVSEDVVWLALEDLKQNNLLENGNELTDYFAGVSRREAVKRISLASMVALPLISSLVAPTSIMAQSDSCVPTNVCFAAGTVLCPIGCEGPQIFTRYTTTNGSCSVFVQQGTTNCSGLQGISSAFDFERV